jgi:hypothetical protein
MNVRVIALSVVAVAALSATAASAATRYHHYRHHHYGYNAYGMYRGDRPTGPSSQNFEMGSGWNNGSASHPQYGRPDHW